jgi:hypothetical protein
MFEILAPAFILILAGICKAVSDTLADHPDQSIFPGSWDKDDNWRNKWKAGDPTKGEAFPGSSTLFVAFTDAWHFSNAIQYTCFILAIVLYFPVYGWWIDAIILKVIFTGTFEVFYRWILIKRK